jgi:hypothetical protein
VSSIISDASNVAVSGDIVPYLDNTYSLGLSTQRWKDVFVGPGSVYIGGTNNATRAILEASNNDLIINRNGGRVGIGTVSPSAALDVSGTSRFSSTMTISGDILPSLTNKHDLGSDSLRWRNIYTENI